MLRSERSLNSFFKIKRNVSKIIKMLNTYYVFYIITAIIFKTFFFFNFTTLIHYYFFKRSPDILSFTCENETRVHYNCRCTRTTSDTIVKFELIVEYTTSYKTLKKKKNIDKGKQNIFLLFVRTSYWVLNFNF